MHIYVRRTLLALLTLLFIVGGFIGYQVYSSGYFAKGAVFVTEAGAIAGYDPVAYFKNEMAILGSQEIVVEHGGATWRFASVEHKELFLKQPDKYLPQYGGYCAYAMSEGYTAYSDPTAWYVSEGRLFLNYSHEVKAEWEKDRADRIPAADAHWSQLKTRSSIDE